MAGQKQVIKIDDSDSEWEEMPVWLMSQEEILPELLPEQSLPVLLPAQIPPVLLTQTLVIPVDVKGLLHLPVLLQEEIPSALLPEQTLVIPVDGMDQTKFTMPSPKRFKGKPAKEVRDAEEKEFKKWVAEGAERPSLVDTWNLMKLPVDNTSACSKNMGLRYAAILRPGPRSCPQGCCQNRPWCPCTIQSSARTRKV